MLDFFKEQLAKVEEELKQLYIDRARSGVETTGSYEIMIDKKKKERLKLLDEIKEIVGVESPVAPSPVPLKPAEEGIMDLIAKGNIALAIKTMLDNTPSSEITLLSGRYNRIKSQHDAGTITNETYSIEMNRVTSSLLALLND